MERLETSVIATLSSPLCKATVSVAVEHNPDRGQFRAINFSYTHEYAYFSVPRSMRRLATLQRAIPKRSIGNGTSVTSGTVTGEESVRNCRKKTASTPVLDTWQRRIVGFGDVCPDEDAHPSRCKRRETR